MAALAEAGFRAIAPDQRGYGQTDVPVAEDEYTILHLVGDIVGLLDALGEQQVCQWKKWSGCGYCQIVHKQFKNDLILITRVTSFELGSYSTDFL